MNDYVGIEGPDDDAPRLRRRSKSRAREEKTRPSAWPREDGQARHGGPPGVSSQKQLCGRGFRTDGVNRGPLRDALP